MSAGDRVTLHVPGLPAETVEIIDTTDNGALVRFDSGAHVHCPREWLEGGHHHRGGT